MKKDRRKGDSARNIGRVSWRMLTDEEARSLASEPLRQAKNVFENLARWRRKSLSSGTLLP